MRGTAKVKRLLFDLPGAHGLQRQTNTMSTENINSLRAAEFTAAMRRALTIARFGPADTENPQVGCVVFDGDGRIIAEGWHMGAGTSHAEVDALAHVPAEWRDRLGELTAAVTLEPCNHTGRTGPCSHALADAGIGGVVYALSDPSAAASGGAEYLRSRGVPVVAGVEARAARDLLEPWFERQRLETADAATLDSQSVGPASHEHGAAPSPGTRPHITVKWAQTVDGRAAADDGTSQWITGPEARHDVHCRRAEADAILVGTGTLIADNPSLTARGTNGDLLVPAAEQPIPVVVGDREIPQHARLRQHPALAAHDLTEPIHLRPSEHPDLHHAVASLTSYGITSVFVEGGPAVIAALVRAGLADSFLIYTAPTLLGGSHVAIDDIGVETLGQAVPLRVTERVQLGVDELIRGELVSPSAGNSLPNNTVPSTETEYSQTRTQRSSHMFTGLIEQIGQVTDVVPSGDGIRLTVSAPEVLGDASHGDSISVSGVCLTVVGFDEYEFTADVMEQTLNMSTLDDVEPGRRVNVERAALVGSRLGGHIVQGHIDGTATVIEVRPGEKWRVVRFAISSEVARFVVDKGSITLDGVSLTVSDVSAATAHKHWLEVSLIPETLEATTLGGLEPGDRVNLETDIVARHVARMGEFDAVNSAQVKNGDVA